MSICSVWFLFRYYALAAIGIKRHCGYSVTAGTGVLYVTVTLMTLSSTVIERRSNGRRIEVES